MVGLDGLPLVRLKFDLMALDDTAADAFKGDLIRRGLLWWLSEFWCAEDHRRAPKADHPAGCRFGSLIVPPPSRALSPGVRKLIGGETPPPAFALWDAQERRRYLALGSLWGFELTLIGQEAADHVGEVIAAVQESAEHGMGHKDGGPAAYLLRSKVLRVTALAHAEGQGERRAPLAQMTRTGESWVLAPTPHDQAAICTTYTDAHQWAAAQGTPVRALSLRFLAPVVLKEGGSQLYEPDLGALARSLMRRLRILSEVHGGADLPREVWGPALDAAEAARLDHAETQVVCYVRHSERNGEQDVCGFTGQAWYSGTDFSPLLPALWYGQWLQVGKGYAYGNGRYQIVAATP